MDFFKSILSDDPDTPKSNATDPDPDVKPPHDGRYQRDVTQNDDDSADGWSFGGLIKTISTRSESVMETYRRDLMEFGLGLKKETDIIRDAASRAVKDLPASLEAGASAAQGALDGVIKSTADIISKETKDMPDGDSETPETNRSLNTGRYSRFEAQLSAIQSDLSTFCEEPEDMEEYKRWKLGFQLNERTDEIEGLIGYDGILESVYRKIVPREVDQETFWCRYLYRVDKLKQQEKVRANLVKRAIGADDDDEELSWDVEDDEDGASGSESVVKAKSGDEKGTSRDGSSKPLDKLEGSNGGLRDDKEMKHNVNNGNKDEAAESSKKSVIETSLSENELKSDEVVEVKRDGDVKNEQTVENKNNEKVGGEEKGETSECGKGNDVSLGTSLSENELKSDKAVEVKRDGDVKNEQTVENKNNEKVGGEEKGETSECGKGDDVSLVLSHKSKVEEEDLEWDEIEDVGSGDEEKILATSHGERPKTEDMRKKLSGTEDDEDLNWDIEGDDEPAKA